MSERTLAGTEMVQDVARTFAKAVLAKAVDQEDLQVSDQRDPAAMLNAFNLYKSAYAEEAEIASLDSAVDELKTIEETVLNRMLASQQSKKSKYKVMIITDEITESFMTAIICEQLIRQALGRDAESKVASTVGYTEERLNELAADQEALKREIRNVQSKKSIMKSRADFSEDDAKWVALVTAESQLKSVRVGGRVGAVTTIVKTEYVDEFKNFIRELLAEVDPEALKLKTAKELLEVIKTKAFTDEDDNDEEPNGEPAGYTTDEQATEE